MCRSFISLISIAFVSHVSGSYSDCDSVNRTLSKQVQLLQQMIENQGQSIARLESMISRTQDRARGRRQTGETFAFTAVLDHREAVHTGNVIKFNKVFYNDGGMYNNITGIVTIPLKGTFIVSYTIEDWRTGEIHCHLKVNGAIKASSAIVPHGSSDQAGATVILPLEVGDTLWVESEEGQLYGGPEFYGTIFTGAYLY